jgi:hypothetical protein
MPSLLLLLYIYPMFNGYCGEFFVIHFIMFIIMFDNMEKSPKFLIEIIKLVSSAIL